MHALIFWLGVLLCWAVVAGGSYWLGYGLARRKYAPPDPFAWDDHVDRALETFQDAADRVTPREWQAAQEHANHMRHQLRDRRDKIN